MKVRVALFGRAADEAGAQEVALEVPDGATLRTVAHGLVARYPQLGWLPAVSRPARNLEYVPWTEPVAEND